MIIIMMRSVVLLLLLVASAAAFSPLSSSFSGSAVSNGGASNQANVMTMEYVPSGMSKEQYQKLKQQEKNKNAGKNLGKVGITSFKSRSFSDWQESGGKNLFPVDPTKVKNQKEIPYMQRPGGRADDSDLGGKKGGGLFGFGGKKAKKEAPKAAEPKPTNWWTL